MLFPSFIFDRLAVSQRTRWQKLEFKGERTAAHLWHDFNFLIASFEGQGEDLSPPIGHGWWLAVDHEVHPVGLGWGWLRVLLRTDHVQGLRRNGIGHQKGQELGAQQPAKPPPDPCCAILNAQAHSDHQGTFSQTQRALREKRNPGG